MQTKELFYSEEGLKERQLKLKIFKNCGIYIIQNKKNNHIYIGSSVNIKQRFSQHKSTLRHNTHRNRHLQNAWNKYGEDTFDFYVLEHNSNIDSLLSRENKFIFWFCPQYNNIKVNNEKRFYHSDETKIKIGLKSKEKFIKNPELKQLLINLNKGKIPWNKGKTGIYTKETLEKMSNARKKYILCK